MRTLVRCLGVAGMALFAIGSTAAAQKGKIELGLDAGVGFSLNDPGTTVAQIPLTNFRVGFFMSDRVSFEPSLSFSYVKPEGGDAISDLSFEASFLYHFGEAGAKSQFYVRPLAGFEYIDLGELLGDGSQFNVGGALGVKVSANERLAIRFEGGYRHGFENDDFDANDNLLFSIGFSFFPKM